MSALRFCIPHHPRRSLSLDTNLKWSWNSSVGVVSHYRLDKRGSIPADAKGFSSSLSVQTTSEYHPASCPMGTGGKAWLGVTLTTHPHLLPRSRMSRSYTTSSLIACMAVARQIFFTFTNTKYFTITFLDLIRG
jgi:hypothetical protein